MGRSWVGLRQGHVITAGGCAVCCVPVQYIRGCAGRVAAISPFSPTHEDLYAAASFLSPSRRDCGHHGVLEAAVPAAALAFAAAAAAPGSAAAAPTGLSHGLNDPEVAGVPVTSCERGAAKMAAGQGSKPYNMTEMSFLNSEVLAGDLMSPFDQSGLGAEESLGLLDDYLEVAKHFKPHGFSSDKAKAGSSEWLAVDGLVSASDTGKEDAFSGTDWMLEKMDLKEFDFDALFRMDDLETMPDELLATLDDTCDIFAPLVQETNKEPMTVNPIGHLPESATKTDQVAPFAFLQPFPCSPGVLSSTPDHSFSLELGSEVDISEGDRKPDSASYITLIPQCVKDEDTPSDNDSGICMSPESYLGSPQHSPSISRGSPSSLPSPGVPRGSPRPKPYDPPGVTLTAKVKIEKLDKKLKKMEQNKTAATRYRQKKRAEQEALTGECKELEKKNEALKEKADSLAKEIQYLKDLIEEVRKARGKKRAP